MNALQTFDFNGNNIRVIYQNGEPWFIASEPCRVLGYANSRKAVLDHTAPSQRNTVTIRDGIRGNPNKVVISDGGLYSLILGSKRPEAQEFKLWVTDVVLPALRKDGMYIMGEEKVRTGEMSEDELVLKAVTLLQGKVARLTEERDKLAAENAALSPKANTFDDLFGVVPLARVARGSSVLTPYGTGAVNGRGVG